MQKKLSAFALVIVAYFAWPSAACERGGWSVVRVPSIEEEDARRLHRELERLRHCAPSNRDQGAGEWPNRAVQRSLGRIDFPIRSLTTSVSDDV